MLQSHLLRAAFALLLLGQLPFSHSSLQGATDILSYHGGTSASNGVNATEVQITPGNISVGTFGKQFSVSITDVPNVSGLPSATLPSGINYTAPAGQVYAQPLIKTGVNITTGNFQGVHDVVFVATSMNSLFAIDADGGTILWKDSFIYNSTGNPNPLNAAIPQFVTAVPGGYGTETNSQDIAPWIGIVGTPVIDGVNGFIYVVVKTREVPDGVQNSPHFLLRLHKIRLSDGFDSSVVIADTTLRTSDYSFVYNSGPYSVGSSVGSINVGGQNRVYLNAVRHMSRPALQLYNGRIYIAFGSHGDNQPYHGWVLTYDAASLAINAAWNATPVGNEGEAGIWQGGGGVIIDNTGNVYFETGNGQFDGVNNNGVISGLDANGFPNNGNYGNCFVKLALDSASTQTNQGTNKNGWGLKVVDYFSPFNNAALDSVDRDLGSGGPTLLPDSAGSVAHPHLLLGAGKEGKFYLIDRDNMGKFTTTDNVVQTFGGANSGCLSVPAYFNGRFYTAAGYGGTTTSWPLTNAAINTGARQSSTDQISFPGCSPYITANGTANGVVWVIDRGTGQLRAYDAANLSTELWTSSQNATRDALGSVVKFSCPAPANGRVYVGTSDSLVAYGPPTPPTAPPPAPSGLTAAPTGPSTIQLTWNDNSNNESGFLVERSSNGVNFAEVATVGVNQNNFVDSGLSSQATYYYRVRAYNLFNTVSYSAYTNIASTTTTALGSQSPVFLYNFDEGSGGAAADSIGANAGTLVGAPLPTWIAPGRIGSANLNFTGNGAYAQVGNASTFNLGFNTTGSAGTGWSFGGNSGSGANDSSPNGVSFFSRSQTEIVRATGASGLGSSPLIVGSYSLRFAAAQTAGAASDIRITVSDSLGQAIFSTTTQDYALNSPTRTWANYEFKFNVTSAPANDFLTVRFSCDAVNNNNYIGWDTVTCTVANSYQSAVRVANDLSPTLGQTSSLLFWIKTTQSGNDVHWMAPAVTGVELSGTDNDISWGYLDGSGRIALSVGESGSVTSSRPINDGVWHHVGISRDANSGAVRLYLDGALDASGTLQNGGKTTPFRLLGAQSVVNQDGTTFNGANYLNAQLDDVRIYNLVIDPAEVAAIALPPAAPTQLTVTPASGTELDLAWVDNANNEASYEIWRSANNGAFTRFVQLPGNTISYLNGSLAQGTPYAYFVRATNSTGFADSAKVSSATPVPPLTPTGAEIDYLTSNRADLSWIDNSDNEVGYKVLRRSSNANFAEIASLPPDSDSYSDLSIQPGVSYDYHIQSYNIAGYSDFAGLALTAPTQPPFRTFLATYFNSTQLSNSAITGATADPDADGINNLLEYAFALNPIQPALNGLPVITLQDGYLTIRYLERKPPVDLYYTVQVSGDLATWNDGPDFTTLISVQSIDDTYETVTIRDNIPFANAPHRYIRLKVTH